MAVTDEQFSEVEDQALKNSKLILQPGVSEPATKETVKKTERIIVFVLGGPGSGKGTQVSFLFFR